MLHVGLTILIVLIIPTLTLASTVLLESDRVTHWGDWGPLDQCPSGSFVNAIDVKIEPRQGGMSDDTAMNAVRLNCVPVDQLTSASAQVTKVLTSYEGDWGGFTGVEDCRGGVAIGFQLRSEGRQGGLRDDTAANDMRLICANSNGDYLTPAKGRTWGEWRSEKRCPPQMAICGLKTQVEPNQGGNRDDTALNNVDLLCCELTYPAFECDPTDSWQKFLFRDNRLKSTPTKYTIKQKVGVQKSKEVSQQISVIEDISTVQREMNAKFFDRLGTIFENQLAISPTTEYTWSKTDTAVFAVETEESEETDIPAKCAVTFFKVVGRCGGYVVNTNAIKQVENCTTGDYAMKGTKYDMFGTNAMKPTYAIKTTYLKLQKKS